AGRGVAGRAGRERDALLEGVDGVLGGAADLAEAGRAEVGRVVARARARPLPGRRHRHRGDTPGDERRLLVEAEGEAEVDQLPERARSPRLAPRLRPQAGSEG